MNSPDPRISRRRFLVAASATSTAALTGCVTHGDRPAPAQIIDTHTHFYDPTRPQGVPWPPRDDALLYRRVLPEDYKKLAEPLGVTGTVVVEASAWLDDNQWVLDLAAKDPFLVGLVGHLEPTDAGFPAQLKRLVLNRRFVGIRIGGELLRQALAQREVMANLKLVADHDLAVDLLIGPEQFADAITLAGRLPRLRLVVDHCANVRIDGQQPPADWIDAVTAAHYKPNLYMKVSGLVEGSGRTDGTAPADVDFYRKVLDPIWNAFGEDRVIYGSNWPVSERFAPLPRVQQIVTDYVQELGADATAKYFHRNAHKAYKFAAG